MTDICPRINKELLLRQCREIGINAGDAIMVHAGLRSVGEILGGPDVLISALIETIGSDGTLMVYVGCQTPYDDVGRNIYSEEDEAFILEHCPPFKPESSRASRDFGAFAELFRTTPGVICSTNAGSRMAAIGAKAEFLTANHPVNYGLGKDSPLERLYEIGGKVVLIGSDTDAVTILHYAEAIAPIKDKQKFNLKVPIEKNGKTIWIDMEEYDSATGIRDWPDRFFAFIVEQYIQTRNLKAGLVGRARTYVLDVQDLVQFAVPIMVQTANDLDARHS
jgi:aminoglycoside 3-N-acetyltransferase